MNLISSMLEFQNQVKIFHWQTYGYAEHQSLGSLYDNLSGFIDEFVEVFMGKYGRVMAKDSFVLTLKNYKDLSPTQAIDVFINYLVTINGLHIGFLLGAIYGATWPLSISIFANKKLIQYFDSSTTTLSN